MKFDVLHNFISPVTGRILADYRYVLVGNRQGIAIPSPILIDIRLDLIALRKRYNTLVETDFIVGHPNDQIPNAQVLVNLPNGFLYNTDGIVSTLPTTPQIPLCYAATTEDLIAIYDNGTNGVGATLTGFLPSEFMIDDQTPPLDSIILVKDQSPSYENGIYTLTTIGDIITSWVLTRVSTYDQPMEIQSGDLVAVEFGTINGQTLWVETQIVEIVGTDPILFIPFSLFNTLPENNIWIGNNLNKPIPHSTIFLSNLPNFSAQYNLYTGGTLTGGVYPAVETTSLNIVNLPDLTFEAIWRGNLLNRPVESQDLTTLELTVVNIEDVIIPGIEAEIAALEAEIVALQAEVLEIQGQIIALGASIAILQGQILIIQGQIAALNTRIDNLRLNNIPADADVSLYNFKIINLADPVNSQDAVNLQSLTTKAVTSITGTANQITASSSVGAVTLSMPANVIITTSVTAGNLELITNTLQSIDTNGNITIAPNGTGNILMIPLASGFVGIGAPTPSYLLDVGGTGRVKKLLGNAELPSVSLGSSTVVGTGASSSTVGSEVAGRFTLTTGTGITLVAGTIATFTLTIAMPSSTFSVVFFPATNLMPSIYATSTSSTVFTLSVSSVGVLIPVTTYTWNYQIIGY